MAEKSSSLSSHGSAIRASASTSKNEGNTITAVDIADHLPIELIKSEIVPPSPNLSNSTSDWLQDFLGLSWIAYAASSLLVISHFPSPLSEDQTLIGPIFRQSIELSSDDESAVVNAVAWSPSSPSEGDVAAAIGNCVCLCSEGSGGALGSLCWTLNTVLVQSHMIEAIQWTGSGDGVVTVGIEIVLWRRKDKTWEIAWKCTAELPQTLVSATWSTEGPVATAIYPVESSSLCGEKGRCVLVWENDGKSGVVKSEMRHPQPVSMIQWRPLNGMGSQRAVLLTCCLDGTMRLWSEIDGWRGKKFGKDLNEQKAMKRSFHVISVIEVNQSLNGSLGTNIFATWAVEFGGRIDADESSMSDLPGKCEWLIGFGPGGFLNLWALHCLDDISPLRFPRVTLWKKQQMTGFQCASALKSNKVQSFVMKAVISRSQAFGPPTLCSLFQFLSDNSMRWLQYTPRCNSAKDGFLCIEGHTGRILQIDVHPCSCEVGLAASLDSNGLVLLWSLSIFSSCNLGMPTFGVPTWKRLGKLANQDSLEYSNVRWAPSIFNDYKVLLLSHLEGIDCFIVNQSLSIEAKTQYHKLCTIPFSGHSRGIGPINIFTLPLQSTCEKVSITNKFMLLAVWMGEFQAISWEVALHFDDLSQSRSSCTFDGVQDNGERSYESKFAGYNISIVVGPCSSELPSPYNCDNITSVGVVPLANLMPSVQKRQVSSNESCYNNAAYHMATGHFDGSLKLWKSTHSQMVHIPWELMGVFQTHQGPISIISLSSCGRKIATFSTGQQLEHARILCIWEIVHALGSGTLLLEGKISFDVAITGLNWFAAGNGQLLLGVCTANEFRVYAQRRIISQTLVKSENLLDKYLWVCIAFSQTSPSVLDFCWGPGATPVLIHERYFSLLSKWSFCNDKKHQPKCFSKNADEDSPHCLVGTEKGLVCSIFTDSGTWDDKELSTVGERKDCVSLFLTKANVKNWSSASKQPHKSSTKIGCWSMLQLAEMLCGPLPVYHPVALLLNIYSGNWRRACAAVQHLVEYLNSNPHVSCDEGRTHNHIIPQIPLSMLFDELSSTELGDKVLQWGQDVTSGSSAEVSQTNSILSFGYNSEANLSTSIYNSTSIKSEISGFSETLEKYHGISGTTSMERTQILAIIDILDEITDSRRHSVYESFDAPGQRFWVSVRFQQLHYRRRFGRLATMEELVVDSELMGWAHHSDCQENLCSSTLSDEPTWQEMRNLGVGFWFTDSMHLRKRRNSLLLYSQGFPVSLYLMEKLARSQYLKNKDPKDCALLYIALNRLQVLAGLFKISRDEKDKPLAGFLSRNFQEEKNKAAALKNAFVLMGRHQHELASAFFLLGGDPSSAITVCAKNLGDEQLALVICRLIEGCGGPLEGHLISKFLLPSALERGDHWLASLLEWLNGNYSKSFLRLLGIKLDPLIEQVVSWNVASFSDPKVGQYGVMLATKTSMKNSIGEAKASMLTRWATAVSSIALNRCGLPLEALECVPCSVGTFEGKDQGSILDDGTDGFLHEILKADNSNWLSADVALYLESNLQLSLASQYISNLIKEHPSWPYLMLTSSWVFDTEDRTCHCRPSVENFQLKLKAGLTTFERKSIIYGSLGGLVVGFPIASCNRFPNEECSNLDDERWLPVGACIWKNLAHFNREHLKPVPDIVEANCLTNVPPRLSSLTFNYEAFASDAIRVRLRSFDLLPETLSKLLISTFECISTSLATQMQSFLSLKVQRGLSENLLVWLEESMKSQSTALYDSLNQETDDVEIIVDGNRSSLLEILWQISIHPKEIREGFLQEQMNILRSISENTCKGWRDLYKRISSESKNSERTSIGQDAGVATTSSKGEAVIPVVRKHSENGSSLGSRQKNLTEVACFRNPEVIYKRNGELIEVMCINSVDHRQAAVASNRKGLAYFTCKDEEPFEYHSEFVWSEADWPRDGWAGSESTPIPTPVSPGIGLGGKGVHLGLGGATIGIKSLARPGRDLTGGGAFGIPGYAGIGASGLGWGIQEDFEEFVDPPATVDNVHSRALSSHPSRPFFLVGSSNTHVYLWEFCKEKATATYGMLPAANVPPPYALASISALQFGPCGHRFATGALDGTVCTWQLEVGGRSNIPPTESSLCFNSHASDISYVAASGSVIAAAGHSSNDVNVVIWDTLAPPTTSQASLTCHQGGARSISVFDNDIGSGSISPLIVTGGTGGDVALHDFRFIATGKTKQHRHPNMGDENMKYSAIHGVQSGNSHKVGEIPKGMLWYIPKAHLGSVTRIATIPNTSLFLTGSKDGDVKLWDAARAKLAAVTDIQVLRNGFLTCGGDGTVKMIKFNMAKTLLAKFVLKKETTLVYVLFSCAASAAALVMCHGMLLLLEVPLMLEPFGPSFNDVFAGKDDG
ncbi:hypothetical protein Syun_013434 [Stephania yunnanensis]|uniref:RAVE complex protein Rav1 C-terminal domain-containing protein n=1 Tax=Stephania yunnanensis TaxID=152371 RepID=A0AAP0K237_9MAGN